MKKIISIAASCIVIVACNNTKPADTAPQTSTSEPATTQSSNNTNTAIDKSAMYGKWNFKTAIIKMADANGQVLMNDTTQGGSNDYFLINADGTSESHIGNMIDKSKYKFINDTELITDDPNTKEKATLKIMSLTATSCTITMNQQKKDGTLTMLMYLTK